MDDLQASLWVTRVVLDCLHGRVEGHLKNKFTFSNVMRDQNAYDFRIVDEVEHGITVSL